MTAKKIMTLALLTSGMLMLSGCEMKEMIDEVLHQEQWVPQEADAISIDEDGTITLYRANYKEEDTKELISGVYSVSGYNDEDNSFYYREERLVKRSLYDYIDDPYASQDANLTKPNWMDYTTVSDWKESLSEYDFEYYCVNG